MDNERMIWLGLALDAQTDSLYRVSADWQVALNAHASVLHRVSADAQTEEIVEVMYQFLLGCGHDPWNVARAMVNVGFEQMDVLDRWTPCTDEEA